MSGGYRDLVAEIIKGSKAPTKCVITKFLSVAMLKSFSPRSKAYIYIFDDARRFLIDLLMMCQEITVYGIDRFIYKFLKSNAGMIPLSMKKLSEIKMDSGDIMYLYTIDKSDGERKLIVARIDLVEGLGE